MKELEDYLNDFFGSADRMNEAREVDPPVAQAVEAA